jgi:synaptobrevin family protein YKT6
VAFALINRIIEEFGTMFSRETWISSSKALKFPQLRTFLDRYQNPEEADAIMKVQKELDETKIVLVLSLIFCISNDLASNIEYVT